MLANLRRDTAQNVIKEMDFYQIPEGEIWQLA